MKRTSTILLAALLAGLAACTSGVLPENPEIQTPVVEFTASIDGEVTRTALQQNGRVFWNAGDEISVNGRLYHTSTGGSAHTTFSPVGASATGSLYKAYYPASVETTGGPVLPDVQTYDEAGANCPMYAESTTEELVFKNICGILKITVNSPGRALRSIRIRADEPLCGPVTIVGDAAVLSTFGTANAVTLDCSRAGLNVDIDEPADFIVALPEGTYSNFKMTFMDADGQTCIKTKKTDLVIARNEIQPIVLSNPLVFYPVTYYNAEGDTFSEPTSFIMTGSNTFPLKFNDIDWSAGDVLEVRLDNSNNASQDRVFMLGGDNAWGNNGDVIFLEVGPNRWINGFRGIHNGSRQDFTSNWHPNEYMINVRFSAEGFEYSLDDGDTYTTAANSNNAIIQSILQRGGEIPLYAGCHVGTTEVPYEYFGITRKGSDKVDVRSVSLDKTSVALEEGANIQLTATISPTNATVQAVSWSTSDAEVATVVGGLVTAVGEGTATITVTTVDGSHTASCTVNVSADHDDNPLNDVFYYSKKGYRHNDLCEIEVTSSEDLFNFVARGLDWRRGDILEISIRNEPEDNGRMVLIGEDAVSEMYLYSKKVIHVDLNAGANWWYMMSNNVQGQAFNTKSNPVIVRLQLGSMSYLDSNNNWNDDLGTAGHMDRGLFLESLFLVQQLSPLYIGGKEPGKINYIKVIQGSLNYDDGEFEGSTAGGYINETETQW